MPEPKNNYALTRPLRPGKATTDAGKALEGGAFESLEFRPMTVEDMLELDDYTGDNRHAFHMIHLLSGKEKIALKRMHPVDFKGAAIAVQEWIASEGNPDG